MSMMEKRIELKVLEISNSQAEANAYALVLEEVKGIRQLPIIIGVIEAQSIALVLKRVKFPRPYTHDLFVNFAETFHVTLKEMFIYKVSEGVFYSYLYFEKDGEVHQMDSRTSDAVALALRFGVPIYTTEDILNSDGVIVEEIGEIILDDDSVESMKKALREAVEDENYELASALRDMIKEREEEDKKDSTREQEQRN